MDSVIDTNTLRIVRVFDAPSMANHSEGWTGSFDKLEAFLPETA